MIGALAEAALFCMRCKTTRPRFVIGSSERRTCTVCTWQSPQLAEQVAQFLRWLDVTPAAKVAAAILVERERHAGQVRELEQRLMAAKNEKRTL